MSAARGYWRRTGMQGDSGIVGTEIEADGAKCPGWPASFRIPSWLHRLIQVARGRSTAMPGSSAEPDAFMPLTRARVGGMRLPTHTSFLIGRLKPGIPADQAAKELARSPAKDERRRIWLSPLEDEVGYQFRRLLSWP
ncbi:MAG: hypothetical protein QM757_09490 [Paludibaculum sp.]